MKSSKLSCRPILVSSAMWTSPDYRWFEDGMTLSLSDVYQDPEARSQRLQMSTFSSACRFTRPQNRICCPTGWMQGCQTPELLAWAPSRIQIGCFFEHAVSGDVPRGIIQVRDQVQIPHAEILHDVPARMPHGIRVLSLKPHPFAFFCLYGTRLPARVLSLCCIRCDRLCFCLPMHW